MVRLTPSKDEPWSKIRSLEVINDHSFKLTLTNGDIRYFNLLDAIEADSDYGFNEYEKRRLKSMYDNGYFTKVDIHCGVISWGGWTEILPGEFYTHTVRWRECKC